MTKSTGVGRGGKREYAYPKSIDGVDCNYKMHISIDEKTHEIIESMSGTNFSHSVRMLASAYHLLSTAGVKPRAISGIAGGAVKKLQPVRKIVPERSPDGFKYALHVQMRKQRELDEQYEIAMAKWRAS